jgi:hypothetical protein
VQMGIGYQGSLTATLSARIPILDDKFHDFGWQLRTSRRPIMTRFTGRAYEHEGN